MNILEKNVNGLKLRKFMADYFFLLLLLVGIAVNYYFEMKVNRAIKKFTVNQELIAQYQQNSGQVHLLNNSLRSLENKVRNYIILGDVNALKNLVTDVDQLTRESVLLSENLRKIVTPEITTNYKRTIRQKIIFEQMLVDAYSKNGRVAALAMLHSNKAHSIQEKFNLSSTVLAASVNNAILAMDKAQQKKSLILSPSTMLYLTSPLLFFSL